MFLARLYKFRSSSSEQINADEAKYFESISMSSSFGYNINLFCKVLTISSVVVLTVLAISFFCSCDNCERVTNVNFNFWSITNGASNVTSPLVAVILILFIPVTVVWLDAAVNYL
jgi:hypothetical protein